MNTCIVICGKKYNIGTEVVLWNEPGGFNSYDRTECAILSENRRTGKNELKKISGKRYGRRGINITEEKLTKIIRQFFLHHSGLYRAADTFNVLHRERGLSVHFILDDDGTLYQCLDLKEKAYHGGLNNKISIGIEIDSRGDAKRFPGAYDGREQAKHGVQPRRLYRDYIQGRQIMGYEYNDSQYKTLIRLATCLTGIFPNLFSADFPRDSNGNIRTHKLLEPLNHLGYICHYNTNSNKIDPIAFDHRRLLLGVRNNNPEQGRTLIYTLRDKQNVLNKLGYNLVVDGIWGPKTRQAIVSFQRGAGLVADGAWGPITQAAVEKAMDRGELW